jgi:hypothetical protein
MGVLSLLRKLAGADVEARRVDSDFKALLNGVDAKNVELDRLSQQIDEVLDEVSYRQSQISESLSPIGDTSGNQLHLPPRRSTP